MYSNIDASHEVLFPKMLSRNSSVVGNVEFDKALGRGEHGINIAKRKIPRPAAYILLPRNEEEKDQKTPMKKSGSLAITLDKLPTRVRMNLNPTVDPTLYTINGSTTSMMSLSQMH